ncbi:MAG: hypothetical protein KAY37_05760 [Phycisphaerae bacterium]|nr:hypothetical protein [Phycisphaerae bacterium]
MIGIMASLGWAFLHVLSAVGAAGGSPSGNLAAAGGSGPARAGSPVPLLVNPMQGWDVNFWGNTRFYGAALPVPSDRDGTLYFASGFFFTGPMGGGGPYSFNYRNWALFLWLDEEGRPGLIRAEEGPMHYLGWNPSPCDYGYIFMLMEGNHGPAMWHSGSIWIDYTIQEWTDIPKPRTILAEGADGLHFDGQAWLYHEGEPQGNPNLDFYITSGTLTLPSGEELAVMGTVEDLPGGTGLWLESRWLDHWGDVCGDYWGNESWTLVEWARGGGNSPPGGSGKTNCGSGDVLAIRADANNGVPRIRNVTCPSVGLPGDWDEDGDVDLDDFAQLAPCMTGPGIPVAPGCEVFDFGPDGDLIIPGCPVLDCLPDGDVDLDDFAVFQQVFTVS